MARLPMLPKTLQEAIDAGIRAAELEDLQADTTQVSFGGTHNTNLHVASLSGTLTIHSAPSVALRPTATTKRAPAAGRQQ